MNMDAFEYIVIVIWNLYVNSFLFCVFCFFNDISTG